MLSVTGNAVGSWRHFREHFMNGRAWFVLLLLAGSVVAQVDTRTTAQCVRVRVRFANGACAPATQVKMMGKSGVAAAATAVAANDRCEADFFDVPAGTYRLSVSGQTLAETDAGTIRVTPSWSSDFEVKVNPASGQEHDNNGVSSASVSAFDLAIPASAQKEFDKASHLIDKQEFSKAIERLDKAIAIYPSYVAAYTNLAVTYARLGDRPREREALQKAISIDDRYAPAYVNLGRLDIALGDFSGAESVLNKAASYDPADTVTLELLTYSQFMNRELDQVITTGRKAHQLHGPHSVVHQLAADAYEQKHEPANAISELEFFLQEESSGPQADRVRQELNALRANPQ